MFTRLKAFVAGSSISSCAFSAMLTRNRKFEPEPFPEKKDTQEPSTPQETTSNKEVKVTKSVEVQKMDR